MGFLKYRVGQSLGWVEKMRQKCKSVMFAATVVFLALLAVNVITAVNAEQKQLLTAVLPSSAKMTESTVTVASSSPKVIQLANEASSSTDVEKLKEEVPKTYAEAEAKVLLCRGRFLVWTNNLQHVVWGYYGNGYFVGTDNLGVKTWGIHQQGIFVGFYDGKLFYGKYRNGFWKAEIPFEQLVFEGRYVLYPQVTVASTAESAIQALSLEESGTNNQVSEKNAINVSSTLRNEIADAEKLKSLIPPTPEEAESQIVPVRNRFLLWTYDLKHIMWGTYGNGFFVGTDNLGTRAWGIYRQGVFAGFSDGRFFYGRYYNSSWKARGLFGEASTYGRYVIAPVVILQTTTSLP